jgi:hypothetical protein
VCIKATSEIYARRSGILKGSVYWHQHWPSQIVIHDVEQLPRAGKIVLDPERARMISQANSYLPSCPPCARFMVVLLIVKYKTHFRENKRIATNATHKKHYNAKGKQKKWNFHVILQMMPYRIALLVNGDALQPRLPCEN